MAASISCDSIIDEICNLGWEHIDKDEIIQTAIAYHYFSVQFRENLEIACCLYPDDQLLQQLRAGECDTDNLSPWPGVAESNERMNHDEFIRRLLQLNQSESDGTVDRIGRDYLERVRSIDDATRAASIASYEDGGLSRVFRAILRAERWDGRAQRAFEHFLREHIRFDTDDDCGHGALARHLCPGERALPLWLAFRDLLVAAVPSLARAAADMPDRLASVAIRWRTAAALAGDDLLVEEV